MKMDLMIVGEASRVRKHGRMRPLQGGCVHVKGCCEVRLQSVAPRELLGESFVLGW